MQKAPDLSAQQAKVLSVIARAAKPQSAYDILAKATDIKSPPTVYRALEKLQQLGLIHRLESLNAYVACDHHGHSHERHGSQFAICTACGDVQELAGKPLASIVKQAENNFLARVDKKVIELSGICRSCDQAAL